MKFLIAGALLAGSAAVHAQAKIDFASYEGPDSVQTGTGGTKITKNGIDYWTSGTPPRRFQVIGRISDRRSEEMDGGNAIGSPKVAKLTKKAGGHAVIMLDREDASGGGVIIPVYGVGLFGASGSKTTTNFTVVKYLDNATPAPAP